MFVGCDEWNIPELVFKVNAKGFDTVAHGISRNDPWEVLEEIRHNSFFDRLIKTIIVII